jgi:NAD(P)-dependent dehydrogenase (short-subunit alcohol dehydrogenase family)
MTAADNRLHHTYAGRRVAITGGASFIGSHLAERLTHAGATVTVVDDLSSGCLEYLSLIRSQITFLEGDLCERRFAAQALAGHDMVFHLAASHGGRGRLGMAFASETLAVLMNAGLPVLVSSTGEPTAPARAIGIIRDEHRSLAAVLHAWMHLIATARAEGKQPDRALMRAIVRYLKDFPVALHHPKEDDYLFRLLRERTSSVDAELDELQRQHERDHQRKQRENSESPREHGSESLI